MAIGHTAADLVIVLKSCYQKASNAKNIEISNFGAVRHVMFDWKRILPSPRPLWTRIAPTHQTSAKSHDPRLNY